MEEDRERLSEERNRIGGRRGFENALIQKAWTDEAFKQALLTNPKETIESELSQLVSEGINIPANLNMTVLEETPNNLYLVIPENPNRTQEELSDEELEAVAGGVVAVVVVVTGAAAVNAGAAVNVGVSVNVAALIEEAATVVNVATAVNTK